MMYQRNFPVLMEIVVEIVVVVAIAVIIVVIVVPPFVCFLIVLFIHKL